MPRPRGRAGTGHTDYCPLLPADRKPQLTGPHSRLSANPWFPAHLGACPLPPEAAAGEAAAMDEDLHWILDEKSNHNEVALDELWALDQPHNHSQAAGERR
jgi:hypothetical protein